MFQSSVFSQVRIAESCMLIATLASVPSISFWISGCGWM